VAALEGSLVADEQKQEQAVAWQSAFCSHGTVAYMRCSKCVLEQRQERREDRQAEAFDRLATTLAALHAFLTTTAPQSSPKESS
jgi:hypothetical protein